MKLEIKLATANKGFASGGLKAKFNGSFSIEL
jgi:hypothetical protein